MIEECDNANIAAHDILNLRLHKQVEDLSSQDRSLKTSIDKNQHRWSNEYLSQMRLTRNDIDRNLRETQHLIKQITAETAVKFMRSVKRIANTLIKSNCIKRIKLGSGAPRRMDSDDEEHLLNIIEGQGSDPHGRRRDEVSYVRKRYTKQKLKQMVNDHRLKAGKSEIKSSSTVYNIGKCLEHKQQVFI